MDLSEKRFNHLHASVEALQTKHDKMWKDIADFRRTLDIAERQVLEERRRTTREFR